MGVFLEVFRRVVVGAGCSGFFRWCWGEDGKVFVQPGDHTSVGEYAGDGGGDG